MKLLLLVILIIGSCQSCSKDNKVDPVPEESVFIDTRDGQSYNIKKIGTQIWMTENLNYDLGDSFCDDCATCGRLYNWSTAKTVAPLGWHLPSDEEWMTLINFLGGTQVAGGKMKSTSLWKDPNAGGTNSSGFSALPCGYHHINGLNFGSGEFGYWWSSTVATEKPGYAHNMGLSYSTTGAGIAFLQQQYGLSVRCVKD